MIGVGSLVECIDDSPCTPEDVQVLKTNYTVRGVVSYDGSTGLLLDEIVNAYRFCRNPSGSIVFDEPCYKIERFREIEFPPALTESIQECLTRELEVVK